MKISKTTLFWINILFWSSLTAINFLQYYVLFLESNSEFKWELYLSRFGSTYSGYMVLSVPYYFYINRIWNYRKWKKILFFTIGGMYFSVMHICLQFFVMGLTRPDLLAEKGNIFEFIANELKYNYGLAISSFLFYGLISMVIYGIRVYEEYHVQKETASNLAHQLTSFELNTLKMQLQPHFLFNALNTVSMMVYQQKNEEAIEMIDTIGDLLRNSISTNKEQKVTLQEELTFLEKYISIERARFADRFTINYAIDKGLEKAFIPTFITQPLVENVFKHAVSKSMELIKIDLSISQNSNNILLSFRNEGFPLSEDFALESQQGIGLKNTSKRLKALYPNNHEFSIHNLENNSGVEVKLLFPLEI